MSSSSTKVCHIAKSVEINLSTSFSHSITYEYFTKWKKSKFFHFLGPTNHFEVYSI